MPNVPFWDAGEYIATSYILGVPHAPGTPLYVLIGRIFTLIPFGEVAQRVNWLSAFSSSLALLFVYLISVKVTRKIFPLEEDAAHRPVSYLAGLVGALVAGFATTFWDNAIEAEVYASSCAIMAFVVWLALRWQERLDEGMSPQEIADSIGRMADLEHADILIIRSVANDLLRGDPVRASDDEPAPSG